MLRGPAASWAMTARADPPLDQQTQGVTVTLSHVRRAAPMAFAAVRTGLVLVGPSTAQAACPRGQVCQPPEPAPPLPDLVVVRSANADPSHVTVKNIGTARAGAFTVRIAPVSGLAPEIRR